MKVVCAAILLCVTACVRRAPVVVAEKPPPPSPPPITKPDRTIRFEPVIIQPSRESVELSALDDTQLNAIGNTAMAAGDNAKAVIHFERLADFFPESTLRPVALYKAGLLLEKMKDYAGALSRFLEAAKADGETAEGGEARFKAADEYFFLGDYEAAITLLQPLSYATYLPGVRHAEADTKRAVCLFTEGKYDDAEKLLRAVLKDIDANYRDETHDGYLPSQAQFYLAEIFRQRFLELKLDPIGRTKEQLGDDLEHKAELLLTAQGHYLRCIRYGHPEWATASGYRIGELYQNLYQQMIDAKPPAEINAEEADAYHEELNNRVRVLVTKAIDAYEQTLATAERVGATNPFVQQTRVDLNRMKALLAPSEAAKAPSQS